MKFFNKTFLAICVLPAMLLSTSCSGTAVTDYSNDSNWALKKITNRAKYDLVFFVGTSVNDPTQENGVGAISETMKATGLSNFVGTGAQLSLVKSDAGNTYVANTFVPLYRQMALFYALDNCTMHNDLINEIRNKEPGVDLKAFLDYYFSNYNKNAARPFVLAGHSQGSASLQVMLEDYFIKGGHKSYLKNCVAMYSTGYGVSKKWFDGLDKTLDGKEILHFATGATDTNCMISWNTEGPDATERSMLLSDEKYDTYVINPLNWKTDETPASKDENLGVLVNNPNYDPNVALSQKYIISTEEDDKFDAVLNLERGSVVSSEPNSGTYVNIPTYGAIWGGKSLHVSDGKGFYVNMGRNLGNRLDAWFSK